METPVTYDKLSEEGKALRIRAESIAKIDSVRLAGMGSLAVVRAADGVRDRSVGADAPASVEAFVNRGRMQPTQMVIA